MFQHTHGMTRRLEQRWSLPLTYAHTGFEVGSRTDTHSTRLIWAISKLYRQTAESNAQTTPLCADTTQWYNCIKVSRAALGCLIWRRLKNLSAPFFSPTRLPHFSLTASFQLLFPSAVVFFFSSGGVNSLTGGISSVTLYRGHEMTRKYEWRDV